MLSLKQLAGNQSSSDQAVQVVTELGTVETWEECDTVPKSQQVYSENLLFRKELSNVKSVAGNILMAARTINSNESLDKFIGIKQQF